MQPIFGFLLFFVVAVLVSVVAKKRGLSFWKYLIISIIAAPAMAVIVSSGGGSGLAAGFGAFLVPVALLFIILSTRDSQRIAIEEGQHGDYKKCPFCAESVRVEAIKCKHCGSSFKV